MTSEGRIALEPLHYFSRIAKALTRVGDLRLRPLGFATAQLPVLAGLQGGDALPQADLTKLAGVEQPSMAQLLARMERDGIIRRTPNPHDGRSSLVELTDRARGLLPAGREILQQSNDELTEGFSQSEIETLNGFLQRILQNVEAMGTGQAALPGGRNRHDV